MDGLGWMQSVSPSLRDFNQENESVYASPPTKSQIKTSAVCPLTDTSFQGNANKAVLDGSEANDSAAARPAGDAVLFRRSENRIGKVSIATKLFQGIGALPGQHKEWAFNTLLLLYYSQILGLPATYASIVLAVSLILDAFSDPLVGAYSDNFRSRFGRRHPFMLAAIIPTSGCMFALFSPPEGLSTISLLGWMMFFTVLMRLSFTFFAVPWNAVAAELSEDYKERTTIITYRMVVGWLGGVIFIFAMYSFVFPSTNEHSNGLLDESRYPVFAAVLALLMFTYMTLTTLLTRNQVRFLPQPTGASPPESAVAMLQRTLMALQSRNFRLLFLAVLISAAVGGTGQVFDIFMNLYYWEFSTEDIRWFSFAIFGAVASFLTAGPIQTRYEKQHIMIACLVAGTLLAMIKVLFRFWNVWPENGDPLLLWLFVGYASLGAYFGSLVLIMFASMMADIVDEQELQTGLRQEGVFSAGITFAGKATTSLGLIIGGMLLDFFIRFPRGAEAGAVDADTLFLLAFSDGIAVPVLNLIPFLLLFGYSLTRTRLHEIQNELRRRAAGRS